jgi:hypothetical protein
VWNMEKFNNYFNEHIAPSRNLAPDWVYTTLTVKVLATCGKYYSKWALKFAVMLFTEIRDSKRVITASHEAHHVALLQDGQTQAPRQTWFL